jgi:hypothetical protein
MELSNVERDCETTQDQAFSGINDADETNQRIKIHAKNNNIQ